MTSREEHLVGVFVRLADTLVRNFDVVDLFDELVASCTDLLDAAAAGLLLANEEGSLTVASASSEATNVLELLELQSEGGPGAEAFHLAEPFHWEAANVPQAGQPSRWPRFHEAATAAGFTGATAVPMRLRDKVLGALTVFRAHGGPISDEDLVVAQALADVASIAILQDRAATDDRAVISQLQTALDSRIVIEQAKGVVAQETGVDMDQAYSLIRRYARDHNERLRTVAENVVAGVLTPQQLRPHA